MATKNGKTTKGTVKRASRIVLGESLDIGGATKLHTRLKTCAEKDVDVNLNAAKVESIDTSSLQLLLAFIQRVRDGGHGVNWQKPSEALLKTAALAGLTGDLGLAGATE